MLDPTILLHNEIINVTSEMRKNARWASAGVSTVLTAPSPELLAPSAASGGSDALSARFKFSSELHQQTHTPGNPLMDEFSRLRRDLMDCEDFSQFDSQRLLAPFLDIVASETTTGVITSVALASLSKIFAYGIINENSVNISAALYDLASAITHCRFEATDRNEDDGVLLRIVLLMQDLVCSRKVGNLFSDESICEIVETCLSMACQMRRGDVLRRTAEMAMFNFTQKLFSRLKEFKIEETTAKHVANPDDATLSGDQPTMQLTQRSDDNTITSVHVEPLSATLASIPIKDEITTAESHEDKDQGNAASTTVVNLKPYGIPCVREIFRVLTSILDPKVFHQYTDSTRVMALKLVNSAFETAGEDIEKHPFLMEVTYTSLTKHLLQLIRHDNPTLVYYALRVFSSILCTCKSQLKLQQELLFSYLLTSLVTPGIISREENVDGIFFESVPLVPRLVKTPIMDASANKSNSSGLSSGKSSPVPFSGSKSPEIREIMIEFITSMSRTPSFFTDLYVNYDCDVNRTDLAEDIIGFLCRNAYPDSASLSTQSVPPLCLEAVLSLLQTFLRRSRQVATEAEKSEYKELTHKKGRKNLVVKCIESFNEKPKKGIQALIECNIIKDDSPESIAHFLRDYSARIDKKVIGEYISHKENTEIRNLFVESFNFNDTRIDEALREFLATFRLPGESALIERIMEKFAHQYCLDEKNREEVAEEDAAFVLSYAIIMLNVDRHSPQVKQRMTIDQFKNNLRQQNKGEDFSHIMLEQIYRAIDSREIVMPDEHQNDESFEYTWKDMLCEAQTVTDFKSDNSFLYDQSIFASMWKPLVTTLSYVFATASDDAVLSRVITGLDHISTLAEQFEIYEIVDYVANILSKVARLPTYENLSPLTNCRVQIEDSDTRPITISPFSIQFGFDFKAQMATMLLFRTAESHPAVISKGWKHIIGLFSTLYTNGLLIMTGDAHFKLPSMERLPAVKPKNSYVRPKGGKEIGLLSTLSSYLTGYSDVSEPSDEEVDATLSTLDCLSSCHIDDAFTALTCIGNRAATAVEAALTLLPSRLVDDDVTDAEKKVMTPRAVYILEMCSWIAISNNSTEAATSVLSAVDIYLTKWKRLDKYFVSRIIGYALLLTQLLIPKNRPVVLKQLQAIDIELLIPLAKVFVNYADAREDDYYWVILEKLATAIPNEIFKSAEEIIGDGSHPQQVLSIMSTVARLGDKSVSTAALERLSVFAEHNQSVWYEAAIVLSQQCLLDSALARATAFRAFQRLILSDGCDTERVFNDILFPFVKEMLKPEVFEIDPKGMSSIRMLTASLMCQLFLRSVVQVQQYSKKVFHLWMQILEMLDRLVNSGQKDAETVVESLKNVLLVVSNGEFGADDEFWNETWKILDSSLPGLKDNVFPSSSLPTEADAEERQEMKISNDEAASEVD